MQHAGPSPGEMCVNLGLRDLRIISQSYLGDNYHLLSRSFCQCVAIAQIVDLDVFDVVSIGNINLSTNIAVIVTCGGCGRLRGRRRSGGLDGLLSTRTTEGCDLIHVPSG